MTTAIDSAKLARLERMLDRQDILDALLRFTRGIDRFDRDLFLSAFHDDATIAAGVFVGGPIELYSWAATMHEHGQSATQHNILNHTCDISGDTAHTETYYLFVGRNRDNTNWLAGGRYIDRFERRNGEWKIATRSTAIEWATSVPSLPLPFADLPDIHLNGAPTRDQQDLSYRRPLTNKRPLHIPPSR